MQKINLHSGCVQDIVQLARNKYMHWPMRNKSNCITNCRNDIIWPCYHWSVQDQNILASDQTTCVRDTPILSAEKHACMHKHIHSFVLFFKVSTSVKQNQIIPSILVYVNLLQLWSYQHQKGNGRHLIRFLWPTTDYILATSGDKWLDAHHSNPIILSSTSAYSIFTNYG